MSSTLSLTPARTLAPAEFEQLHRAKTLLENPGFAAKIANVLGAPIERGFALLPPNWNEKIQKATHAALLRALKLAVSSLHHAPRNSADLFHKVLVGGAGGIGGAFGLAAIPIELPISTTIMLRSIADIARSEGHQLDSIHTRLACLEVFALGSPLSADDSANTAYWTTRMALGKLLVEAAAQLGPRGVVNQAAPVVGRLVGAIASRFGVIVSQEIAAKAVPLLGAATGSAVNVLFLGHFQNVARGHFIVKRLEDKYGAELVRNLYQTIPMRGT